MPAPIKLIVGLGNPGPDYSATRHNAGFWFLDRLVDKYGGRFSKESKFFGELARLQFEQVDCRLLKPDTYMNESGRSVQAIMDYYKISAEECLVVHDEIDLEPGIARLKKGGGHAGHNGVRDIINKTGNADFLRIRIGVGHPGDRDQVIGSVLGKPSMEEQRLIDRAIDDSLEIMPLIFKGESNKAMTQLNSNREPEVTGHGDNE